MAGDPKFVSSGTRRGKGVGSGEGWGGPAKGGGNRPAGLPRSCLIPGQPPAKRAITAAKVQSEAARAALLKNKMFDLAMNAEREETQLAAAVKLLERIEGTPVPMMANASDAVSHLSDAELEAELARRSPPVMPPDPVEAARAYERMING